MKIKVAKRFLSDREYLDYTSLLAMSERSSSEEEHLDMIKRKIISRIRRNNEYRKRNKQSFNSN